MEISRGENIFSGALAAVEAGIRWNKQTNKIRNTIFLLYSTKNAIAWDVKIDFNIDKVPDELNLKTVQNCTVSKTSRT